MERGSGDIKAFIVLTCKGCGTIFWFTDNWPMARIDLAMVIHEFSCDLHRSLVGDFRPKKNCGEREVEYIRKNDQ